MSHPCRFQRCFESSPGWQVEGVLGCRSDPALSRARYRQRLMTSRMLLRHSLPTSKVAAAAVWGRVGAISRPKPMAAADSNINTNRQIHTERVLRPDGTDSGVRIMHLNKPDTLNSLTEVMAGDFAAALQQLQGDSAARALIVTGVGERAFSAGGGFDFIQQRMDSTVDDNAKVLAHFFKTFLALRKLPIVSIAAINGAAVGGGMGLAAAADIRLAASNARLGYNFVKLGLSPGMASTSLLPALTSHQVACRLLLTGDLVFAQEAKELGLVLDVVQPEQLMAAALDLAHRIAAASPAAVAATLKMLRQSLPFEQLEAAADLEAQQQAAFFLGPDIKKGLAALKERRLPKFEVHTDSDSQ